MLGIFLSRYPAWIALSFIVKYLVSPFQLFRFLVLKSSVCNFVGFDFSFSGIYILAVVGFSVMKIGSVFVFVNET